MARESCSKVKTGEQKEKKSESEKEHFHSLKFQRWVIFPLHQNN